MLLSTKSSPKDIGERLQKIRRQTKLTRPAIQAKYGLSQETLKSWESGRVSISADGLEKCIDIYSQEGVVVSKEWIVYGKGLGPVSPSDLKFLCSEDLEFENLGQWGDDYYLLAEQAFFESTSKNAVTARISDDSMLPLYQHGDRVGGRLLDDLEQIRSCVGKDCIVFSDDIKFIRRLALDKDQKFMLLALNPEWGKVIEPVMYDVSIQAVAPIVWHRRRLSNN